MRIIGISFLLLTLKIEMIEQIEITLPAFKRGYHLITDLIEKELPRLPEKGLVNILLQHTSAAISLNENADPSVRYDLDRKSVV